jgi:membrane associated rhomboid family serine protease
MIGLYFFGNVLEEEVKSKWWLGIYFLSGIIGNVAYGFTSAVPVVGASGCVFGLMGAAMLLKPKEIVNIYIFPLPLGIIAILFAIVETFLVYFGPMVSGVAHVAHVGGMIIGFLFAFYYFPKQAGKGLIWLIFFVILLIFLAPIFGLIIGMGGFILEIIDFVIGIILYSLAKLLSFLW